MISLWSLYQIYLILIFKRVQISFNQFPSTLKKHLIRSRCYWYWLSVDIDVDIFILCMITSISTILLDCNFISVCQYRFRYCQIMYNIVDIDIIIGLAFSKFDINVDIVIFLSISATEVSIGHVYSSDENIQEQLFYHVLKSQSTIQR